MEKTRQDAFHIGETIRQLRQKRNLTQAELAGDAFSKSYISQLERGNVTPSIRALEIIAAKLGVSPSWLMGRIHQREATLLRAASVAFHAGDVDYASQLVAKAESCRGELVPPLLWDCLLLKVRIAAARENWNETLRTCRALDQVLPKDADAPESVAVPLMYWWGYAWRVSGNQRQAIRRWEEGLAHIRGCRIEAEALRLMERLAALYAELGDDRAALAVHARLHASIADLHRVSDLSRWAMARFAENASGHGDAPSIEEGLREAEAWAKAEIVLETARELRQRQDFVSIDAR